MAKYKATRSLTVDGVNYVKGDVVELSEADAASRLESGSLVLEGSKKPVAAVVTFGVYRALEDDVTVGDKTYKTNDEFDSEDTEEMATLVSDGKVERVTNSDARNVRPSAERLEEIKTEAKEAKEAGAVAPDVTNEERNFNTGQNLVGVNSPDPIVGDIVPVDIVMPGQVVDPKSGKVLEGAGTELSTPTPNASDPVKPMKQVREETKEALDNAGRGDVEAVAKKAAEEAEEAKARE